MLSKLKITNSFFRVLVLLAVIPVAHATIPNCDQNIVKNRANTVDVICDNNLGRLYLKYSPAKRRIWLESADKTINKTIQILQRNANPELVGADKNMRFVTRQVVNESRKKYLGLIIAERSLRGNGGGQCEAGSEEYFVSYRIEGRVIKEMRRFLIHSCNKGIDLDTGDGNDNNFSVTHDESLVTFKWLTYLNSDSPVMGRYSFITNKLEITKQNASTIAK